MSSSIKKMGLVFTYNNKPHENKSPLPNLPMPSSNASANASANAKANYLPMNRRINSTNPTSMRSLIRIPAGGGSSCSSCGH